MLTSTPSGLQEIIATFGRWNDPDFEEKNIVLIELPYPLIYDGRPVKRARCHKLLVENFHLAFRNIKSAGMQNEARNYAGIYAVRSVRASAKVSTHAWGIAIDLEPIRYPLGSSNRFPDQVIEAFKKAGFFYGGDFKGRKDPMHFQFATDY